MASTFSSIPAVDPRPRRWTRDEYNQMAELGWFEGQRVELIEGEIVEMSPQKNAHAVAIELARIALSTAFGPGFWIRTQLPLELTPTSSPEPDLAVVGGSPRSFTAHPNTALLVVEISDTTLDFDRRQKASLYARAGIAEYWIVDLVGRQLEIFRSPVADAAEPFGWSYSVRQACGAGEFVDAEAAPAAPIAIRDLLP